MLTVQARGTQQTLHLVVGLPIDAAPGQRAGFDQQALVLMVSAALLSLWLTMLLATSLTRPITKLTAAARDVAAGDLRIRLPVGRSDEVGQLSASVNALASALEARVQAFEESEQFHLQTLREVEEERTRLATLLNALRSGILLLDGRGQVLHASPRFLDIWHLDPLPIGTWVDDIIPALVEQVRSQDGQFLHCLNPTHSGLGVPPQELQLSDGRTILLRMETAREGTQCSGGAVWLFEDVTAERRLQQDASRALRDPMTDLLNRRGFDEVMAIAAHRKVAMQGQIALMVIDLDDFKRANDLGGHQVGDEILNAVGRALSRLVRRTDHVARLGGDEFAVVLTDVKPHDAGVLASRMIEAVSTMTFKSDAGPLRVGCSIGVALMPDPVDPKALYAQADAAMYQAKRGGKNAWFIQPTSPAAALEPT